MGLLPAERHDLFINLMNYLVIAHIKKIAHVF
jgi:hypothetical protein